MNDSDDSLHSDRPSHTYLNRYLGRYGSAYPSGIHKFLHPLA
jgi:hypothetical protein